jgi:transposase
VVERFGSKVEQYRRVATRYDKRATSYPAFVHLAVVLVVLKHP